MTIFPTLSFCLVLTWLEVLRDSQLVTLSSPAGYCCWGRCNHAIFRMSWNLLPQNSLGSAPKIHLGQPESCVAKGPLSITFFCGSLKKPKKRGKSSSLFSVLQQTTYSMSWKKTLLSLQTEKKYYLSIWLCTVPHCTVLWQFLSMYQIFAAHNMSFLALPNRPITVPPL